jgi:hypothetical protein
MLVALKLFTMKTLSGLMRLKCMLPEKENSELALGVMLS